jgi:hypothetical protein
MKKVATEMGVGDTFGLAGVGALARRTRQGLPAGWAGSYGRGTTALPSSEVEVASSAGIPGGSRRRQSDGCSHT